MTEQTEAAPDDRPEREIQFQGRDIWVRMPSPEALLVWKRTLVQLQGADGSDWNGEQMMAALERLRKIIDSVILHEVDKTWLDDGMLDGTVKLVDTAAIITKAVESFGATDNRESRRAAAKKATPAKKAVRKAAPRKAAPRATR